MLGLTRMRCLARSFPFCANRLVQKNLPRSVGALQKTPCYGQTHAFARGFATPVNIQQEDSNVNETQDEITKDALEPWIKSLESFANEPWLLDMPYDPLVKLRMSLALLYLLLLRLPRSDDREKQDQFRALLKNAVVPPESEIARGRRAIASVIKTVLYMSSRVSEDSPLRHEHADLFGDFGKLRALYNTCLKDVEGGDLDAQDWSNFWDGAEPILKRLLQSEVWPLLATSSTRDEDSSGEK